MFDLGHLLWGRLARCLRLLGNRLGLRGSFGLLAFEVDSQVFNCLLVLGVDSLLVEVNSHKVALEHERMLQEHVQEDLNLLFTLLEKGPIRVAEPLLAWKDRQAVRVLQAVAHRGLPLLKARVAVREVEADIVGCNDGLDNKNGVFVHL